MNTLSNEELNHVAGSCASTSLEQYLALELLALLKEREAAVPDEVYSELYKLREDIKGPDGFDTWKDAAIAEKAVRIQNEKRITLCSSDIDYLTAMAAFHSDQWHKMDPITGYMHGWNARKLKAVNSNTERDACRYRFLRDKDAFGDDAAPGLASWDELAELDLNVFDAAVDARMAGYDTETYNSTPPAQPVAVPVRYMNRYTGACYTLEQQPDAVTPESIRDMFCHLDDAECVVAADVWNACRAAMLNQAPVNQPASNEGQP